MVGRDWAVAGVGVGATEAAANAVAGIDGEGEERGWGGRVRGFARVVMWVPRWG